MTTAQYKLLEKVFGAEIEGRLHQSKDKRFKALEEDGCIEHVYHQVGRDRFGPIVVTGWSLTHRGRILYCQWAAQWEEKVINEAKVISRNRRKQSAPVRKPVLPHTPEPGAAVPHRVRRVRKDR